MDVQYQVVTQKVYALELFTSSKWTYVRADDFVGTKISWMHRKPNFLSNGSLAAASALRAQEPLGY